MKTFKETIKEYQDPAFIAEEYRKRKLEEKMSENKYENNNLTVDADDFFPEYDEKSLPLVIKTNPRDLGGPLTTPEEDAALDRFYSEKDLIDKFYKATSKSKNCFSFDPNDAWIQTFSGKRFTPTNPVIDDIVIEDIAHALSMQCRFSGHSSEFYSVAQHSVLVSYICDEADALWGLMHDASEAYLVDVPRPLKQSGKFGAYMEFEANMQKAICQKFNLPLEEPASVKKADARLLATEAKDLMTPIRSDWVQAYEPLPFKIESLPPQEAKVLFMKRFVELIKKTYYGK
jgi:hypothetical protein